VRPICAYREAGGVEDQTAITHLVWGYVTLPQRLRCTNQSIIQSRHLSQVVAPELNCVAQREDTHHEGCGFQGDWFR
jgi:hypothetical protein